MVLAEEAPNSTTTSSSSENKTDDNGEDSIIISPSAPRILFIVIYAWLSISCGRFVGPFLKHECAEFLSDKNNNLVTVLRILISSICGVWGSSWADEMERKYPLRGRCYVLLSGTFTATVFFLLHGLHHVVPSSLFKSLQWHVTMQCCYTACVSMVRPVLDGITIALLNDDPKREGVEYGIERLYGAVGWGGTHVIMGICFNYFGYSSMTTTMYLLSLVTALISLFAIKIYATRKLRYQQQHRNNQQQQDQQQDQRRKENSYLHNNTDNNNNNIFRNKNNNSNTNTKNTTKNTDDKEEETNITTNNNNMLTPLFRSILINNGRAAFFFSYLCLCVSLSIVYLLRRRVEFSSIGTSEALMVLFEIPIFRIAQYMLQYLPPSTLLFLANILFIIVSTFSIVPPSPFRGVAFGLSRTASVEYVAVVSSGNEAFGQSLVYLLCGTGEILGLLLQREQYHSRIIAASVLMGGTLVLILFFDYNSMYSSSSPQGIAEQRQRHSLLSSSVERNDELQPIIITTNNNNTNNNVHRYLWDVQRV